METKELIITPAMAAEFKANGKRNRTLSKANVFAYAKDMAEGKWELTHQGIAFDTDGKLSDGYHRIEACILSNAPFKTLVTYGVPITMNIDSGRMRSDRDRILTSGIAENGSYMADGKMIAMAKYSMFFPKRTCGKVQLGRVTKYMEAYADSMEFVFENVVRRGGNVKGMTACWFTSAVFWARENGVKDDVLRDWAKVMSDGKYDEIKTRSISSAKSILLLRNRLMTTIGNTHSEPEMIDLNKKVQSSIRHFVNDESVTKIYGESVYSIPEEKNND